MQNIRTRFGNSIFKTDENALSILLRGKTYSILKEAFRYTRKLQSDLKLGVPVSYTKTDLTFMVAGVGFNESFGTTGIVQKVVFSIP